MLQLADTMDSGPNEPRLQADIRFLEKDRKALLTLVNEMLADIHSLRAEVERQNNHIIEVVSACDEYVKLLEHEVIMHKERADQLQGEVSCAKALQ